MAPCRENAPAPRPSPSHLLLKRACYSRKSTLFLASVSHCSIDMGEKTLEADAKCTGTFSIRKTRMFGPTSGHTPASPTWPRARVCGHGPVRSSLALLLRHMGAMHCRCHQLFYYFHGRMKGTKAHPKALSHPTRHLCLHASLLIQMSFGLLSSLDIPSSYSWRQSSYSRGNNWGSLRLRAHSKGRGQQWKESRDWTWHVDLCHLGKQCTQVRRDLQRPNTHAPAHRLGSQTSGIKNFTGSWFS